MLRLLTSFAGAARRGPRAISCKSRFSSDKSGHSNIPLDLVRKGSIVTTIELSGSCHKLWHSRYCLAFCGALSGAIARKAGSLNKDHHND